jgi:quercetin dioxygenase-like cupin family protein
MTRHIAKIAAASLFLLVIAGPQARADKVLKTNDITVSAIDIGDPSKTVIGQRLGYPKGRPVMKAFKITIPPGKATSLHLHEVSIFAYVLSGTLEVDYGTKGKKRFGPGQGFMEAVHWCHKGRAVGRAPVVLVALYLGTPSLKNSVTCKK